MIPPLSEADMQRVLHALRHESIIQAIKIYREITGLGLAEAKYAVEAIRDGLMSAAASAPAVPIHPSADGLDRVRLALSQGSKIEAIKHYRDITGAGLAMAKQAVEAMEAGLPISQPNIPANVPPPLPQASSPPKPQAQQAREEVRPESIHAALYRGNKVEAARIYREVHHVSLPEAMQAVDEMEKQLRGGKSAAPEERSSGCFKPVMFILIAMVIAFFFGRALLQWLYN